MLNFQNFYITKGPTTSAEKYPASTKSVRQPRPCRGETLAFRQLSAVTESARGGTFPFLSLFGDFNAFLLLFDRAREDRKNTGYFGESTMSATFPGLVHDAEVGEFIYLTSLSGWNGKTCAVESKYFGFELSYKGSPRSAPKKTKLERVLSHGLKNIYIYAWREKRVAHLSGAAGKTGLFISVKKQMRLAVSQEQCD